MNNVIMSSRLKKILNNGVKQVAKNALKKTLDESTKICKDNAPVDTGTLRDGITSQHSELTGKILSSVDYWTYVNYGTSSTNPQPFVSDTAQEIPAIFDEQFINEFEKT